MDVLRGLRRAAVMVMGAAALACSDDAGVTAPQTDDVVLEVGQAKGGKKATRTEATGDTGSYTGVVASVPEWFFVDRRQPLAEPLTASSVVGIWGGMVKIPGQGELRVPWGALDRDVEITLTARAGTKVAFELEPHGLKFARDVSLWIVKDVASSVEGVTGVYYEGDPESVATILEFVLTFDNPSWIELRTDHFSGFALASGRSASF